MGKCGFEMSSLLFQRNIVRELLNLGSLLTAAVRWGNGDTGNLFRVEDGGQRANHQKFTGCMLFVQPVNAYRFLFWGAEVRGSGFLAGAFLAEAVFGVLCLPAAPFLGALPGLEGAPFLGLSGLAEV